MSAPDVRTSDRCTPLIAAWVPTGMKAGVRMTPCAVVISPWRAAPSVAKSRKRKACSLSMRACLAHARWDAKPRLPLRLDAADCLFDRPAVIRQHLGPGQNVETFLGGQAPERLL